MLTILGVFHAAFDSGSPRLKKRSLLISQTGSFSVLLLQQGEGITQVRRQAWLNARGSRALAFISAVMNPFTLNLFIRAPSAFLSLFRRSDDQRNESGREGASPQIVLLS